MNSKTVVITGAAGFIGFHTSRLFLQKGFHVIGIDNLGPYYDVRLKENRLAQLKFDSGFKFHPLDICDASAMEQVFDSVRPSRVVHLAAQAGVRYSLENPAIYAQTNVAGFLNILECCRKFPVKHLVYASSSSVYGLNSKVPFSVQDGTNHPVSLYGATKKANEVMAHSYSHLFNIPASGLRLFTVYGPWGRPDMSLFKFTEKILSAEPIDVYNYGNHKRDFTFIDDVALGIHDLCVTDPKRDPAWNGDSPNPATSSAPHRIFNLGNHSPVPLMYLIETLENKLGKKALINKLPQMPGDVLETHADISESTAAFGFAPSTSIEEGVSKFVDWYLPYRERHTTTV